MSMSPYQSFDNEYASSGSGMLVDDVTGNIAKMSDSVVLNIENSSSASSSVDEVYEDDDEEGMHQTARRSSRPFRFTEIMFFSFFKLDAPNDDYGDDDDDDDGEEELHCDDWEIRMLAAELNRRESKRDEQLLAAGAEGNGESGLLRRRSSRKRSEPSETDTEPSEPEVAQDQVVRPRAASLDQHNLRREKAKGVFKAFSFDRDKDRL